MSSLHSQSRSPSPKRSVAAVAAAIALMVAAAPGEAAVVASFDPAFGPSIPNLGFKGTITLNVGRGCYAAAAAAGGGFIQTGSGCDITATSAEINFYNSTLNAGGDLSGNSGPVTTVELNGSYFDFGPNSSYVTEGFFTAGGQLEGLATLDSGQFAVNVMDSGTGFPVGCNPGSDPSCMSIAPINYQGSMLLYFTEPIFDPAYLVDCSQSTTEAACSRDTAQNSLPALNVTFSPDPDLNSGTVPEPGSVPLGALGLVALFLARRRRSRAALEVGYPQPRQTRPCVVAHAATTSLFGGTRVRKLSRSAGSLSSAARF